MSGTRTDETVVWTVVLRPATSRMNASIFVLKPFISSVDGVLVLCRPWSRFMKKTSLTSGLPSRSICTNSRVVSGPVMSSSSLAPIQDGHGGEGEERSEEHTSELQ